MLIEALHRKARGSLAACAPLEPIRDEHSYRRALEILDRLFLLGREQTREESELFQALARIAYDYECNNA